MGSSIFLYSTWGCRVGARAMAELRGNKRSAGEAMDDDTGGSRKRGIFVSIGQDVVAKAVRMSNVEFRAAFQVFDQNRSGTIDLDELNQALMAVQQAVEASTSSKPSAPRP